VSWFDLPGDWLTAFAQWFYALVQWFATHAPQFLTSLPWSQTGGTPSTGSSVPNLAATPELDSLVLFGTGLLGAGSYVFTRIRARRQVEH
jgi:hypothetical protein